MSYRLRCAALIVMLAGSALGANQTGTLSTASAPQTPQTPTFRLSVEFVEVDAVVTDASGAFVRDLKRDDFQVFEDGKPQVISTFSLVDIPVERFARPLYASEPIEPDVKSNERPFDGRVYVMIVDDLHTSLARTARVKAAARQFIQQHLGANDLMAIVHTAGLTEASQDFTSSKRLLLAAVDRTAGRKLDSATLTRTDRSFSVRANAPSGVPVDDPLDTERSFNARQSLGTLRDVAQWFASVRGRRKAILFVSEGIDYDVTSWIDNTNGSAIVDSMRDAIAAAGRGNVSIYGIDPRGLTGPAEETIKVGPPSADPSVSTDQSALREVLLAQSSLRELSNQTGGFAVVNAIEFSNAFDRIVHDNSSYYVLAYYPPIGKSGTFHRIDLRVNRPGVTVRARQGYVAAKAATPALASTSATSAAIDPKKLLTPDLRNALDSPLPLGGLVMHVFAAPFKGTAPNASVLLGIELRGRDLRLDESYKVTVAYTAIDAEGKVRRGNADAVMLDAVRPETKARISETGLRLLERVNLPPGRYQVHVAAEDGAGGNVGSVLYDLEVPDFAKAPFSMSGLALTSAAAATQATVRPDELLRAALPGPPVAARTFPQDDELALFVEVYDNQASMPHKVDITATVTTDTGQVMVKTDEVRDSSEIQGRRGGYGYGTRISMRDLAPGPYVLTVSARSRLGNMPAVQRQVQFTVTATRGSK